MSEGWVETHRDGAVLTVVIANQARANCLTEPMLHALRAVLSDAATDDAVRAVLLRGAGDRHFCAGLDLDLLTSADDLAETMARLEEPWEAVAALLREMAKPTFALLLGDCYGGGVQLAASCDLRLASDRLRFCIPAARMGMVYPVTALADLVALGGPGAVKRLLLEGEPWTAEEALRTGFVEWVEPAATAASRALELAQRFAALPGIGTGTTKAIINALVDESASFADLADLRRRANASGELEAGLARLRTARMRG